MAFNFFKVKKWVALFIIAVMPMVIFIMFIFTGYSLFISAGGGLAMAVIGIPIFSLIVKHPLLSIIEGAGLLVMTYDSTGVIDTFIAKVTAPFVRSMYNKEPADSLYDRQGVFYLKNPKKATIGTTNVKNGEITLEMKYKKKDENNITFAFGSLPCLIYNKNMQCFLTKESLAKMETESVIKHLVIYLKKKTEELTSVLRDFARYVVETTKPQKHKSIFSNWMFWIGILVLIALLAYMFLPGLSSTISGAISSTPPLPETPGIIPRT